MASSFNLVAEITKVVSENPGVISRDIVRFLNDLDPQRRPVRKTHVNPVLYRDCATFRSDGLSPPRWYSAARPTPAKRDAPPPGIHVRTPPPARPPVDTAPVRVVTPPVRCGRRVARPSARAAGDLAPCLYAWQRQAFAAWAANAGRGIVEAVTGSGKTMLALHAIGEAVRAGERCLVLVPSQALLEQWRTALEIYLNGVPYTLLGGGHTARPKAENSIVIGIVNSVRSRAEELEGWFDLLIADEVHRYGAELNRLALLQSAPRRMGLTATLERADDGVDSVLKPYFGRTVYEYDFGDAKRDGVIAPFSVALVGVSLTEAERDEYEEVSTEISDLRRRLERITCLRASDEQFAAAVAKLAGTRGYAGATAQRYNGLIVNRKGLLASSDGKARVMRGLAPAIEAATRSLVFCAKKEGAERASDLLNTEGVETEWYHSERTKGQRAELLEMLQSGELKALTTVNTLDEGVDVPDLDLGVIVSTGSRRRQMIQRMGRIVRRKKDGRGAAFVVLFARETIEDPRNARPGGYVDTLRSHAEACRNFDGDSGLALLDEFVKRSIRLDQLYEKA